MIYLGLPLAGFLVLLLVLAFVRIRTRRASYGRVLEDEHIAQIEQEGWITLDTDPEPLDMSRIEEAEREFWTEERWDEGEEWG